MEYSDRRISPPRLVAFRNAAAVLSLYIKPVARAIRSAPSREGTAHPPTAATLTRLQRKKRRKPHAFFRSGLSLRIGVDPLSVKHMCLSETSMYGPVSSTQRSP